MKEEGNKDEKAVLASDAPDQDEAELFAKLQYALAEMDKIAEQFKNFQERTKGSGN